MFAPAVGGCLKRFMSSSKGRLRGPSGVTGHGKGGYKIFRNIALFVGFPLIGIVGINCYLMHQDHNEERPEFVKWEYLRIRSKRFPWGEGSKSLFHNKEKNPLPDGYED